MSTLIEKNLKEALLKLKEEVATDKATKESLDKVEVWSEMLKLKMDIDEDNNRAE